MPDAAAPPVVSYPERRAVSLVASTGDVPQGTLLNVPSAPPTGPSGPAPIVAANTVEWYLDPVFISTAGGAVLSLVPVVVDALSQKTFDWKSFVTAAILALAAYFRNNRNTVVK